MADMNNFGEIKEGFKYLSDILDSMRMQNAVTTDNTDKVLITLNNKIEGLASEEDVDFVKLFLSELKKSFEERSNFMSTKFSEFEETFKFLSQRAENQLQASELKEIFDIIATNLSVYSQNFSEQKDLIADISTQIDEFRQDDSDKKDILRNVSVLKNEIEKFSNGFESVILNLNNKFKELSEVLLKMDSREMIDAIKKDIENVFMSTNAVLSTLQVIDHKNRELENIITHVVTKDDFNQEREQVNKLIAQNLLIIDYVDKLPTQGHVEKLVEKVDSTVNVIDALKNMLNETGQQNQQMLTAQLDSLESKILNISTEEEFIGFRKELSEFAQTVMESTNAMRSDIESTNTHLKTLSDFLTSMNIESTFEGFANATKISENNVKESVSASKDEIVKEISKNKNLVKKDIDSGVQLVNQKIEETKEEISEASKSNLANILENIQGIVNNIFSVKNAIHIENEENLDAIDGKIEILKDEIVSTSNFVAQAAHKSSEEVKSTIEVLSDNLVSLQEDLVKTAEINSTELKSLIEDLKSLQGEFDAKNQADVEKLLGLFGGLSSQLSEQKNFLNESSQVNFETLSIRLQSLIQKIEEMKSDFSENSESNFSQLQGSISDLPEIIKENQLVFENEKRTLLEENSRTIEEMGEKIQNLIKGIIAKDNPFKSEVLYEFTQLKNLLETFEHDLNQSNEESNESLKNQIKENIQSIEDSLNEYNQKSNHALHSLQSNITEQLEHLRQVSSESDLKLSSSLQEASEIKSELESLKNGLVELSNDEALREFSANITRKLDGLLVNITQMEEIFTSKNENALRTFADSINQNSDANLEVILEKFEQADSVREEKSAQFIENVTEKAEILKEQLGLVATDISSSIENKNTEVMSSLDSIMSAVSKVSEINFEQMMFDVKNQVDKAFFSIPAILKDNLKKENDVQLENITSEFSQLNDKLEEIISRVSEDNESDFENIKSSLRDLSGKIGQNSLTFGEKLSAVGEEFERLNESILGLEATSANNKIDLVENIRSAEEAILESQVETKAEIISKLASKIQECEQQITSELLNSQNETKEEILGEISKIDILESIVENQEELKTSVIEGIVESSEKTKDIIIDEIVQSQNINKMELMSKIVENSDSLKAEAVDEIRQIQDELKLDVLEKIKEVSDESKASVLEEIRQLQDESKSDIFDRIQETSDMTRGSVVAEIQQVHNKAKIEILETVKETSDSSKESVLDEIRQLQDESKIEILDKIAASKEETESAILDELSENLKVMKEIISSFAKDNNFTEELSTKIKNLYSTIQTISTKIEKQFADSEENYKTSTLSVISDVKTSFYEKVDDSIDELRSFIEILENNKDVSEKIEEIKSDISEKISETAESIENSISSISVKEDLKEVNQEVKNSLKELMEELNQNLNSSIEEKQGDIFNKTEEINKRVEELKRVVGDEISEKFDKFELSSDTQQKMFDDLMKEVKDSISELKESYIELSLNSSMELSGLLVSVQDKVEDLNTKLDGLNFNDDFEKISAKLENINTKEELKEEFEVLNQKLDLLNLDTDDETEKNIEDIKENLSLLSEKLTTLDALSKLEKLDKLDVFKAGIQSALQAFGQKINSLNQKSKDESISSELNSFKEELMESVIDIFNQISFVEESEDIKDFVEEKAAEIKAAIDIKPKLKENFDSILNSLDDLHEKTINVDGSCFDIKKDIEDVKKHLQLVAKALDDGSDYTYTMQDVESDIAKVRLILKELSEHRPDLSFVKFDKMNEDIISISTRTNKLLLNSDESYNELKENLNNFREIIYQVEEKVKYIDNSETVNQLDKKIDEVNNLVLSCVKSDKIFNQTFMYLAEWIDKTDEKTSKIEEQLLDIKKSMVKPTDLELLFDKFAKRFDKQQEKIKSLETKIESLTKKETTKNKDLKAVIQEALSKVEMPEFKPDAKLVKKVEGIDKQLTTLGKNIEKITSYVD